ncbi:MAG: B12-binding domain-containing radical SAM protein [Syntrophales bacterium]
MNILLVNPPNAGRSIPEEEYGITSIKQIFRGEPFSLEVIAAPLGAHEVLIADLKCEDDEYLWNELDRFQPQVVGFTAVTCEANTVLRLAAEIKSRTRAVIAVGGNHATLDPAFFNRPEVDYVVAGLGKRSFAELVNRLAADRSGEGIPGIAKTSPEKPLTLPPRLYGQGDLMEEHPPRYDLVEKWRSSYVIERLGLRMGFVATAEGCTHRCSFCAIPEMTGRRYLTHSAESVVRDIGLLGDIPFIRMVDANSFGDPRASEELCDAIVAAGIKKRFFGDIRVDTVVRHRPLLKKWQSAGLYAVVVGFEELQPGRLGAYGKSYDAAAIQEALSILHEMGLLIVGDFIIAPDYREEDFRAVEEFIGRSGIQIPVLSVLTPIPGTPLYESMKERITIRDLDYYTFTNAVIPTRMPEKAFYGAFSDLVRRLHGKMH